VVVADDTTPSGATSSATALRVHTCTYEVNIDTYPVINSHTPSYTHNHSTNDNTYTLPLCNHERITL